MEWDKYREHQLFQTKLMIFVGFAKDGLKLNIPTLSKNQVKLNPILFSFILSLKITDQP